MPNSRVGWVNPSSGISRTGILTSQCSNNTQSISNGDFIISNGAEFVASANMSELSSSVTIGGINNASKFTIKNSSGTSYLSTNTVGGQTNLSTLLITPQSTSLVGLTITTQGGTNTFVVDTANSVKCCIPFETVPITDTQTFFNIMDSTSTPKFTIDTLNGYVILGTGIPITSTDGGLNLIGSTSGFPGSLSLLACGDPSQSGTTYVQGGSSLSQGNNTVIVSGGSAGNPGTTYIQGGYGSNGNVVIYGSSSNSSGGVTILGGNTTNTPTTFNTVSLSGGDTNGGAAIIYGGLSSTASNNVLNLSGSSSSGGHCNIYGGSSVTATDNLINIYAGNTHNGILNIGYNSSSTSSFAINSSQITIGQSLIPAADNTYNIGASALQYSNGYFRSLTVGTTSMGSGNWGTVICNGFNSSANTFNLQTNNSGTSNNPNQYSGLKLSGTNVSSVAATSSILGGPSICLFPNQTFTSGINVVAGSITAGGNFYPYTNNTYSCGATSFLWTAVWATNGTIQTSDIKHKTNVSTSSLGLNFINSLQPKQWNWINSDGLIDPDLHFGVVYQDVDPLDTNNEYGFLYPSEGEDSSAGICYTEMMGPLIKAVQELSAKNKELETQMQNILKMVVRR